MSSQLDESIIQAQNTRRMRNRWSALGAILVVLAAILFLWIRGLTEHGATETNSSDLTPSELPEANQLSREQIQQVLASTSQLFNSVANNNMLVNWQPEKLDAFKRELDKAYNTYEEKAYEQVIVLADKLEQSIRRLQSEFESTQQNLFEDANSAFQAANYQTANIVNEQLLSLNPDFQPALELKQRLMVANQIEILVDELAIAKVENNLDKQRRLLEEIVALDPQDLAHASQLSALEALQTNELFAEHYAIADQAFEDGDFDTAKRELSVLRKISPNRAEIDELAQRIEKKINVLSVERLEQQVTLFIQADEWATVGLLANKGLKQFPNNALLQEASQKAQSIENANKLFDRFINQPTRLRDQNIQKLAQNAIKEAELELALSPQLLEKSEQLLATIEAENQPVSIEIISDNRTMIQVLGVGVVGRVQQKLINLKPGHYRIEGTRDGFKSIIVELIVEPNNSPSSVEVVCSQRI